MPGSKQARVYVGRIPLSCREKDLDRFFRNYGRLRDIILKNGYGFVEFEDDRDADDAVYEMNGKDLLGERVTVEHARGVARRPPPREREQRRPVWLDSWTASELRWVLPPPPFPKIWTGSLKGRDLCDRQSKLW